MLKVIRHGAIMFRQNHHQIDWFWEVLMAHLLPVGQVSSLEHITKLTEALDIAQIDFIRSAKEIESGFVKQKLNTKSAIIFINFDLLFRKIIALQLVGGKEHCLSVPGLFNLKNGVFLYLLPIVVGCLLSIYK